MSKRKKSNLEKPEVMKQADYYKLKTQAVDDLVNADESNSPEVSEEELNAYRSGPKLKVAEWAKLLFIKAWFAGSVCFFFIWGLGTYLGSTLDILIVTGTALGIVTDLMTNNVLRFFEKTPGANNRWMMVSKKGYVSFPLNILYAYVVLLLIFGLYSLINMAIARITGRPDIVALGVEPILFGVFYLGFDLLLIQAKHLLVGWIRRMRKV